MKHFPKSYESCGNCACDLLSHFWEHGCTVGIDLDPPVWPLHPGRMVEASRAPALVVDLWSGLLTVLNVSGIVKIGYESHKS